MLEGTSAYAALIDILEENKSPYDISFDEQPLERFRLMLINQNLSTEDNWLLSSGIKIYKN